MLGVGFSAWAVVEVRTLKRRMLRRGMLPGWVDELEGLASLLLDGLEDFPRMAEEMRSELVALAGTLDAIEEHLPRRSRRYVQDVRNAIRNTAPLKSETQVRVIRDRLRALIRTIRIQQQKDTWQ